MQVLRLSLAFVSNQRFCNVTGNPFQVEEGTSCPRITKTPNTHLPFPPQTAFLPTYHRVMTTNLPSEGPILVSACLAGRACRYDGTGAYEDTVATLVAEGRAVLVCPEVEGGLGTPRPAAEIQGGDGDDVLDGRARVITRDGLDVTDSYIKGAKHALAAARASGAKAAILKARSPSCGKAGVYDGTFTRSLQPGDGVTAALLRREGIEVVTEDDVSLSQD